MWNSSSKGFSGLFILLLWTSKSMEHLTGIMSVVTMHRRYSRGLFQFGQIYSQTCKSDNCPRSGCYPFYRPP
jgi:hypothetical protein